MSIADLPHYLMRTFALESINLSYYAGDLGLIILDDMLCNEAVHHFRSYVSHHDMNSPEEDIAPDEVTLVEERNRIRVDNERRCLNTAVAVT